MKNIFKFLFFITLAVTAFSCDNEDQEQLTISPKGAGEITSPEAGTAYVLNPEENQTNTIFTITWNSADYDVPTAINYVVEFAKAGTSFAEPFTVGSTSNTFFSLNIGEFNGAAVSAGLSPFVEEGLDIRITSTVGSLKSTPQVSGAITILVTPFTTDLPKLSVPGNHQGWDPATAPRLAASAFGKTDYVGYIWLDGGHKFVAPNETGGFFWGNIDWGWNGTDAGKLVVTDETDLVATAGYYYVQADTNLLTYKETPVSWGIIGAATPTGWDSDTDLVYDAATRTLSIDINLIAGGYKFRGNNEWGAFEFGSLNADGFIQAGGDFTFDGTPGNYHVVLDLSNPREYTYTLTPNF
ncbi:MAG: SusE domain-containing protein [Lutibacter sp.]|nr:SusE domain-containing protein [Lutibacter sp.]